MLMTLVLLCAVVALVGLLLVLLLVVPFVRTVDVAERRGFSTDRWGAVCVGAAVLAAGVAAWVEGGDHSRLLHLVPLALVLSPPLAVSLLDDGQARVGGGQGAHER
jgi:hypothetical protein